MYILKALLGSLLALSGLATSLSGSILWLLQSELVSNTEKLANMEQRYFISHFGPKFFVCLMIIGFIKTLIGIKTAVPKTKSKGNYGLLSS